MLRGIHKCEDRFHIRIFDRSSHLYDFHIFLVIYSPLEGLFKTNVLTSSQLAC